MNDKTTKRPPCPKCKGYLYRDRDARIGVDRIVCANCGNAVMRHIPRSA